MLCGYVEISGGVTSIAGKAEANMVSLGCGDMDDSITIGTYVFEGSHVSIVEGQTLVGSNGQEYAGLLSSFSHGLNGTTLRLAANEVAVTNGTGGGRYAKGESVTITANEPAAGKRFEGWIGTDGLTFTSGSAITPTATFTMPARDVKVTATYEGIHCALTFYEDAAGTKVWRQAMLDYGASLSGYENYGMQGSDLLTKDGYTFAGWATEPNIVVDSFRDKNGNLNPALEGKLVDFTATITEDVDAYPIWIRDRLEVVIGPGGTGVSIDAAQALSFSVNIDEKIVMRYLKDATRAGYDLAGWYTEGGVLWNGEDWETLEYASEGWSETAGWGMTPEYCDRDENGLPVKQTNADRRFDYYTVTLTARWTPKQVGVAYDVGEDGAGDIVDDKVYGLGDAITVANAPTPIEGKAFTGWKVGADETLHSPGGLFAFDDWSLVGNDGKLTFAAQYVDAQAQLFTVSFDANGGSQVDPIRVPAGSKIASPATAKDGYDFDGW